MPGERSRVVLDCRWLGWSGAGRLTELLLEGLRSEPPPGTWVLWGPPEVKAHLWPGATWASSTSSPTAWSGQRDAFRIPSGDLVVFLHQQRPLRRVRSITMVLDTQPLRHNRGRLDGLVKRLFLRRVVRISDRVLTISEFSRRGIEVELGAAPERLSQVPIPVDVAAGRRVLERREAEGVCAVALYVGLFLPHKNLARLVEAFGTTDFRARGGQLLLIGGKDLAAEFRARLSSAQGSWVTVIPHCPQEQLEGHMARALFLVQPSLEEGYGLPVAEALASGLPVCASDAGALPEVARGMADLFDPSSIEHIAEAIDRTAARASGMADEDRERLATGYVQRSPSVPDLAASVVGVVTQCLAEQPPRRHHLHRRHRA